MPGGLSSAPGAWSGRPIFDWFFRHLVRETNIGTVEGKVSVVEELVPRLKKITNPVERDLYQKEIARVLGINERALVRKIGGAVVATGEFSASPREKKRSGTGAEDMLLAVAALPSDFQLLVGRRK